MIVIGHVHDLRVVLRSTVRNRPLVRDLVRRYIPHHLRDPLAHVHNKDVWIIEDFYRCLEISIINCCLSSNRFYCTLSKISNDTSRF